VDLKAKLAKAAKMIEPTARSIHIAAVIAQALRQVHQDPVLVGGTAVEFYTQGGYATADIDMLAEGGAPLIEKMKELGFEKLGKDFVQADLKIYVEFPGRELKATERYQELEIEGQLLKIIAIEDLIVDRLCAYKFWQSAVDGINAMLLLEVQAIDEDHLTSRTIEEDVQDVLNQIREVREEVIRKKLNPDQANALLVKKMRSLKPR
jgi:predicted nucleotidyltransferase